MLTLGRFKALAESYGADLRRWPEELRSEAQALLASSPEARACLGDARVLDEAISAASQREDAVRSPPGEADAALARLRSAVEARIAPRPAHRRPGRGGGRWLPSLPLRWAGMATGGSLAILAGLLIGAMYSSGAAPDNVLTLLDPAPIQVLTD
jgi:hypothetical protein